MFPCKQGLNYFQGSRDHGYSWVIVGQRYHRLWWVKDIMRQARGSSSKASFRVSRPQFGSAGWIKQKQPETTPQQYKITTAARHSSNWMTVKMLINTALGIFCVSHDGYAFVVPFGMVCVDGGCVTWPSWRCRRVIWLLEWFWPFPVFVN